ncbi:uncharacterized protein LOC111887345 [Lactuca sativa]|uniref:uncharacterized protein LOC111887345 n=1 Tax=Lactuca sativa TaxID=4236 RepID=UPI000CD828FB|nr:uncharacterized protein LOC111887345 [Lactuca sativa]
MRLSIDETQLVEDLIRKNVKPKDILSTLKKENVENLSILPTIYNARQKFRMKENSGKTQMQVVMSFLAENDYMYYSRADKSTNELQDLFFAHQRSLEMWRTFPHVMLMDATYKTNRYEIPLLEIVGEPERHNTFLFQQPSTFYSNSLMSEIPNEFHPYVTNIEDVEGDGNCGFRDDINNVQHSLSFTGFGSAQSEYWLIMPDTGFLIANKYGVIVYFLDKQGSLTCFPLWHGPQDISHHRSIVIAFIYNGHYVKVDLQELHPMPTIMSLPRHHRSERAAGWEILYNA